MPKAGGLPPAYIWPPAIDPLTPKNMALSPEDAAYIVDQFGIDVERPLLTQVSRFDPWKDPLGVIDAYRSVKEEWPDVQLALVGSMAHDDPEGWDYYSRTVAYAAGDPDVYILSNLNNIGSVEVNAFQVHSSALIQKSTREGFGLTVTEGLWKTRPMVASRVGGIVAQVQDGETGWLVDPESPDECANACREIMRDPAAARQRALRGKEFVRRNFLMPRLLRDWLVLFNLLAGNDTAGAEVADGRCRLARTADTPVTAATTATAANSSQTDWTPAWPRSWKAMNGASVQAGPVIAASAPKYVPREGSGASSAAIACEVGIQTISPSMNRTITTTIAATPCTASNTRKGSPIRSAAPASLGATGMREVARVSRSWPRITSAGLIAISRPQVDDERPYAETAITGRTVSNAQ